MKQHPWGIFALNRVAALNWPAAAYTRAASELADAGRNGGVVGHYYERACRSIFWIARVQ